jgi:serine acetyltransferase
VPGIEVGKNVCIGAGAVVVKNIPDDSGTWIGNPAKKLR